MELDPPKKRLGDKYSTRSHTSPETILAKEAAMLCAPGSADKYKTSSVNHSAELRLHYRSRDLRPRHRPPRLPPMETPEAVDRMWHAGGAACFHASLSVIVIVFCKAILKGALRQWLPLSWNITMHNGYPEAANTIHCAVAKYLNTFLLDPMYLL